MVSPAAVVDASAMIDAEVLSVLTRLVLVDHLPEAHGRLALEATSQLGVRRHATRRLWPRAWQLRATLFAYDALYVALAEQLELPLLTADGRVLDSSAKWSLWSVDAGCQAPSNTESEPTRPRPECLLGLQGLEILDQHKQVQGIAGRRAKAEMGVKACSGSIRSPFTRSSRQRPASATGFVEHPRQLRMGGGRSIKSCPKSLPAIWIQREQSTISQGFSGARQGALQHKVGDAALCRGCSLLQGLLGCRCQPQVELFRAQLGGRHGTSPTWESTWPIPGCLTLS